MNCLSQGKRSVVFLLFFAFLITPVLLLADVVIYAPGETVKIGEFVYNDDFTPTTDDCTVTIYSPAGATLVNGATMTDDATGWHYYDYTAPATNGKYAAFMSCGTLIAGDLVKADKTFIVLDPEVTDASIATSVWGSGSRTLTAFGSLAADVWNGAYASVRRLTDSTLTSGGALATESYVDALETTVVTEVQANGTLISALNDISAADVWAHGTRSINSGTVSIDSGSVDAVWDSASSGLTAVGSIGELIVDNLDVAVSTRGTSTLTAGDVWASATRTLSTTGVDAVTAGVWANGTRTLTNYGNNITAADVWNVLSSSLVTAGSIGEQLATNVDVASSDILTEIMDTQALINALNDISAADVWAAGTRTLTGNVDISTASVDAIWDTATSGLAASGSVGKLIVDNLDAQVSTVGGGTLTAADVWSHATRTLSTAGVDSIATDVWAEATRTLTDYGNDITAAEVWDTLSSSLTTIGSIGEQLATNVDVASSDILTEIMDTQALINALNDISAADVWAAGTRTLTGNVDISTASVDAIWDTATSGLTAIGSIGELMVENLDAAVSTRGTSNLTASDVWAAGTRTLTDYSTSAVATAVWANGTRTLSNYGNDITAADVWNVLSSSLVTAGSIGEQLATNVDGQISAIGGAANWNVRMGNVERVQTGYTYRTKVFILDASAEPTAPFSVPTVTLYDPDRNIVVSNVPMSLVTTGVYEYTYTVANNAAQGLWEAIASTEVESGKTIQTNDYFEVAGSPAQVLINSVSSASISSISANVTITNEGLTGYEYQYEWCVVSDVNNECGGGDDEYHATAAKFINPSEDWNTSLSASVASAGTYYFKLVVYFGTESSGSSRIFTVTAPSSGGGGGGGGSTPTDTSVTPIAPAGACSGADFNKDRFVDSIDFSILLYFWKALSPFSNPCVDVNVDQKVDSVDFSIMLYQWTK